MQLRIDILLDMKITQKQLLAMFMILRDSCRLHEVYIGEFSMIKDDRLRLVNEILNQQSDEIIEVNE